MMKYLFGSKLLGLDNCRDEDWITFIENYSHAVNDNNKGERNLKFYKKVVEHFKQGKIKDTHIFKALHLYQMSNGFSLNDESYPFNDFNIFDSKEIWIRQLKGYINLESTEEDATKGDILPKNYYHLQYQYQMIKEGVHFISDKSVVQKIHDLEMPSSYFYELRDLINGLAQNSQ